MAPYYCHQKTDASCSLASLTMVINSAVALKKGQAPLKIISRDEVLAKIKNAVWSKMVANGGDGTSLDYMGQVVDEAFHAFDIKNVKVEVVHIEELSQPRLEKFKKDLIQVQDDPNTFMIANFDEGPLIPEPEAGHFSPIAAYDAKTDEALVFDPDGQSWDQPYWVNPKVMMQLMHTQDQETSKFRGYVKIVIEPETTP